MHNFREEGELTVLPKEYEGSFYEVKSLKNEFISSGIIHKITEDGIEITDPLGPMPILSFKMPVKIAVYNNTLGFRMMAGQVYLSNRDFIRIVDVIDFIDYERRRFFRVDIDVSGVLLVPPAILKRQGIESEEPRKVPVRVKDLSLCGNLIETDLPLKIGDELTLLIVLYKSGEEELVTLVRRIGAEDENRKRLIGGEIPELSPRVEQQLCAFLFEQQRQQIRRGKS